MKIINHQTERSYELMTTNLSTSKNYNQTDPDLSGLRTIRQS